MAAALWVGIVRALVTGGAGFIGHHLVRTLVERGDEVVVLDDLSTGQRSRLDPVADDVEFHLGDIRDPGAVDRAMAGVEVVYHEAALPSVVRSVEDPRLSNDVISTGTIEVVLGAARAGARRVILAGSSSVYGSSPTLPRRESQVPHPESPYATSKLAAEGFLHALGAIHGLETVALRYFNIFGPGQDPASQYAAVVPRFITALLAGQPPTVFGDGTQSRDFTHIDNVVSANLLAASPSVGSGLTCNIGCGGRFTLLELLAEIGAALGVAIEPHFEPSRPGDVPHSMADISLARAALGYEVLVPFDVGVRRTVDHVRSSVGSPG